MDCTKGVCMPTQRFPAGAAPRIVISRCHGDLVIDAWDERSIAVETDEPLDVASQDDEALVVEGAEDDLRLRVPTDTAVVVEDVHGDTMVRGIQSLTLAGAHGDVR